MAADRRPKPSAREERPADGDIAARAYSLYLDRGRQDGHDVDDWLQAERELRTPRE